MPKTKEQYDKIKETRKNQLLKCALIVFCDKGYAATTVDDIVKKAKCSHGLFYHYFKGKKDIYEAVLLNKNLKISSTLKKRLSDTASHREKLKIIIEEIYLNMKKDETFAYSFYFSVSQRFRKRDKKLPLPPPPTDENNPIKFIEDLFKSGQEKKEFIDNRTPRECTEMFISVIQGATLGYVLAPKEIKNTIGLPATDFILDIFCKRSEK